MLVVITGDVGLFEVPQLGGLGLVPDSGVASKGESSACNGDGLGSFEREAEDCFPVSPPFAGFSFVFLRRLSFEVPQEAGDDDEGSSVNGVVGKKRPSAVLCRLLVLTVG